MRIFGSHGKRKNPYEVTAMKSLFCGVLMAVLVLGLTGCFEDDYDPNVLRFENASGYIVHVISLTTEWAGFPLEPGQRVKLDDIQNPDFRFEPKNSVQLGSASTERDVVFIDAAPEEKE